MHDRPLYPILAHTTTDYLAIGNHLFVLASSGYIVGNFYRSIVGDSLNADMSEDVENALFTVLAALFVIDALCYYKSMFVSVWPIKRPRRLVEAEAEQRRQEEAEEAEDEADERGRGGGGELDEVGELPWLTARALDGRARSISGASISTTETQEDDSITPGQSPLSSDGWSDTTATAMSRSAAAAAASDLSSSAAPYLLHVDTAAAASTDDPSSVTAAEEDDELVIDPTYSSLLPLHASGLGEVINIVAATIALASAVLPFFSSYLTAPALPHRRAVDSTPKYQLILDNASMFLWLIDSFVYLYAWKHSLKYHYPGARDSYFQPLHAYFWANLLNVAASGVYVLSVVYGFVWTHSERVWLDDDREQRRHVMRVQRTLALGGDVLYLVCALVMEVAWYVDRCDDEVDNAKRAARRERRRRRQMRSQRQQQVRQRAQQQHLHTHSTDEQLTTPTHHTHPSSSAASINSLDRALLIS